MFYYSYFIQYYVSRDNCMEKKIISFCLTEYRTWIVSGFPLRSPRRKANTYFINIFPERVVLYYIFKKLYRTVKVVVHTSSTIVFDGNFSRNYHVLSFGGDLYVWHYQSSSLFIRNKKKKNMRHWERLTCTRYNALRRRIVVNDY